MSLFLQPAIVLLLGKCYIVISLPFFDFVLRLNVQFDVCVVFFTGRVGKNVQVAFVFDLIANFLLFYSNILNLFNGREICFSGVRAEEDEGAENGTHFVAVGLVSSLIVFVVFIFSFQSRFVDDLLLLCHGQFCPI